MTDREGLSSIPISRPGPSPLTHSHGCPQCGASMVSEAPLCRECNMAKVAAERSQHNARVTRAKQSREDGFCHWGPFWSRWDGGG